MRLLSIPNMLALLVLAAAPAGAQPVLITAGTRIISVDSTTAAATLVRDVGSALGDLTVGPDNRIYVAVIGSGRIDRMNNDANGTMWETVAANLSLARQSGLRFDSEGNLYFVDSSGSVLRITGAASTVAPPFVDPVVVVSGNGSAGGIAFSHEGNLLVLNPPAVRRALRISPSSFGPVESFITGLPTDAVGLVVASGGDETVADHTTGQLLVTAGDKIFRCPKTGGVGCTAWTTLDNLGQHTEAFSTDATFAATSFTPDGARLFDTTDNNGHLWKVTGTGDAQRLTSASLTSLTCTEVRIKGKTLYECQPYVGVGVPATSRSIQKSLTDQGTFVEARYLFGSHLFDAASDAEPTCPVNVTAHQVKVAEIRAALQAAFGMSAASYRLLPYLGEEGWITVYQSALVGSSCSHPAAATSLIVAALFGEFSNPRLIRCDDDLTSCAELEVFGVWSKGPVDDDQSAGGRLDRGFGTKFLVVDKALASTTTTFCGFDSPLAENGTYANNQTISVKFSAKTGNCTTGTFDPTLMPVISVLRLKDANGNVLNEPVRVPAASGSSNEPPTFRIAQEPGKGKKPGESKYIFDLSLVPLLPGVYEIGVIDQNSKIAFQNIQINIGSQ